MKIFKYCFNDSATLSDKKFVNDFLRLASNISINKIIESCDVMINIHVELMPSTVLLEGLILKKPIINISMVDKFLKFQYVKDNAVLSISDQSDLVKPINDLLYDKEFSEKLIKNGQNHVRKFLANPGNASKSLADVLNSF